MVEAAVGVVVVEVVTDQRIRLISAIATTRCLHVFVHVGAGISFQDMGGQLAPRETSHLPTE